VILKAAWVVPITAPPIRGGYVDIAAGRIVGLGKSAELPSKAAPVADLGAVILTPGLVNPHTHLELGCYSGLLESMPLRNWIEQLVRLRSESGQWQREQQAVRLGAWQSLRAGVTCVGDISRRNCAWSVLRSIPIRKVCFVELLSLADRPPRNFGELREAVRSVDEDELLTVGVSPHTPYTVPAEQIRAAIALADEIERPWTMHLAETPEEVAFLRGEEGVLGPMIEGLLEQCGVRTPQQSPTEFLVDCCRGRRPGLLAHANYVEDKEIKPLADAGHAVVYCPRAHHFFGHTPHPFMKMRAAGVPVAIGTDSLASNTSLSVLDELQFVYEHVPNAPSPSELLRMVTLGAAEALGLDHQVGSLEPGKQADLAAFACSPNSADPIRDLLESPKPAQAVWVAGQRVV
jgi:cytosine/adenosine deaminase-related metal-dependent hydrolase